MDRWSDRCPCTETQPPEPPTRSGPKVQTDSGRLANPLGPKQSADLLLPGRKRFPSQLRHRSPNAIDVHWQPWSEWWITPLARRCPSAMLSASSTSSVRRWFAIAQPTTRRLHASTTTARYRNPAHVGTYGMSATQSWSGPGAPKSRSTKSGAGRASRSRLVVHARRRREIPWIPALRMSRETRFATDRYAVGGELGVDPRNPVGPSRALVDLHEARGRSRSVPTGDSLAPTSSPTLRSRSRSAERATGCG